MKRNLEHNLKSWRTRRLARRNKCQIIWLPTYQGATWVSLRIIAIWMMVIWDGFTFYEYILPLAPEFKLLHANPYPNSLQTREWGKGRDPSVVQLEVLKAYDLKKAGLAFFVTNPNDFMRLLIEYRNPDTLAVPEDYTLFLKYARSWYVWRRQCAYIHGCQHGLL